MRKSIIIAVLVFIVALQAGSGHGGSVDQKGTFATTFESFYSIVDRVYRSPLLTAPAVRTDVSLSMYRYYMTQHLYGRLIQIRKAQGIATKTEQRFLEHLHSIAPKLPCPVFRYLNGIGDIDFDFENVKHQYTYSFPIWPNENGHFGAVGPDTHWKYMSFPAPRVVAQAIGEDYKIPKDVGSDTNWNLDSELQPKSGQASAGKPTANLLGWKPAMSLSSSQRRIVASCGINDVDFDELNSQFLFNPRLMEIIYDSLKFNKKGQLVDVRQFSLDKAVNTGSVDQLGWLETNEAGASSLSRSFAATDRDVTGMWHRLQGVNSETSVASMRQVLLKGYRVNKKGKSNNWAVYDWQGYQSVPDDWVRTKNTVFEVGSLSEANATVIEESNVRDEMRAYWLTSVTC